MANIQITQLPSAQPLDGTESVPIVQNGQTVQTTTGDIANSPTQTQTFLTVGLQSSLPNSRYFSTGSGLTITDNGALSSYSIDINGASKALNALGNGFVVKTGISTLVQRLFASTGLGITVTNGDGQSGNPTIGLTGLPLALANSVGSGLLSLGSSTTLSPVTITGTTNQVAVAFGTGVGGNPTISLASNPIIPGTESMQIPSGTTAQRPSLAVNGDLRYNTDTGLFEFYDNSWINFGSGDGTVTSVTGTNHQIVVTNPTTNPTVSIADNPHLGGTDSVIIPSGTTAERVSGTNGSLRYNTTTASFEGYANGVWGAITTGVGVSSVATGTGLTGGPITSTGTISIANTGVTAASVGSASKTLTATVNAQGQLTALADTSIAIANTQVSGLGTMSTQNANNISVTGGSITGTSFTGDVTGNVSGSSGSCTGNSATATNVAYSGLTGTVPTWNQDTTGTAAKANALNSATTVINVSSATAPTIGQILTATSGTAATWQTPAPGGVTSVTGTSPVASSGGATPAISLDAGYGDTLNPYASKTANYVLAAPNGSAGTPSFRAIVAADIPSLSYIPYTGASSAVDLNAKTLVNIANLGVNTTTVPTILARVVGDNGSVSRIAMRGYSSDANSSAIRVAKFRGNAGAPQVPISGDSLGKFELAGYGSTSADSYPQASIEGVTTELWSAVARGTKALIKVTPNTTINQVTAVTIDQDLSVTTAGALTVTGHTTFEGVTSTGATGTGKLVYDTSPSLTTPALGTPSALVGTNITGTASGLTAGTVTTNANLTGAVTSVGNATTMNSPLDSLTDVIIAAPVVDQILKYNGTDWVNGAANSISGGSGIEFFNATPIITATGTNNALQILSLSQQPVTTAEQTTTTTSINGTVASSAWLSPALGRTTIDAGIWDYTVFASVNTVGGVNTTLSRQMYAALPFVTGTVTTTGTGTSRTATASAGTPFATTEIVASATNTLASYLQTPQGLYQITARASDTSITITTPAGYANESAVAGTVWKLLFGGLTTPSLTTTIAQYDNTTTQPAFTVTALTKLGGITFVTSTGVRTVTTTYNGTTRNTHLSSPLAVLHNQLGGLQGGSATENYHLTDAEYTGSGTGVFARVTSPTFTGTVTTATLVATVGISGGTF